MYAISIAPNISTDVDRRFTEQAFLLYVYGEQLIL